jgi:signal transduction histidine kinase
MTLRLRLALLWAALTAAVVLAAGVFAYAAESLSLYNELDGELKGTVLHLAERWDPAAPAPDLAAILASTPAPGLTLRAYNAAGAAQAERPNAGVGPPVDPRTIVERPQPFAYGRVVRWLPPYVTVDAGAGAFGVVPEPSGHRWRVYVLPVSAAGAVDVIAFLVGVAPLRDIDDAMATLQRLVPLLAAVGGAAIFVAGTWLAGRLLRPVARLTETAAAIARARTFGRRVPVDQRRDELGEMAATFNEMLDRLEEAYRAQQRFVADAAHELRTPLTAIQANLDLLVRRKDLSSGERDEAVDEARRETRRLVRLVADLLALARADAGVPLASRLVELDRIVMDAFQQVRHQLAGQHMRVTEIEPVLVRGDPDRLKELLLILLDNALKYTPRSGEVSVRLKRRDGRAEVTVQDAGIGIAPSDLPRVFERFYRADPARTRDPSSTGLGLSIAKWIVDQHGGSIALASEPGRGTTATVCLPLHHA